jgi:hypothetical protein
LDKDLTISLSNLLLAAVLIAGGAKLIRIIPDGRRHLVSLDTAKLSTGHLVKSFEMFTDRLATLDVDADREDWEHLFDSAILGTVDREYRRLKRLISKKNPSKSG